MTIRAVSLTFASSWLLALLLPAGCSTGPDKEASGPRAQVFVYREDSRRDRLFPMLFTIDGQPVVSLGPGQGYRFDLPPGEHTFGYEMGVYNCTKPVTIAATGSQRFKLAQSCVIEREPEPTTGQPN